MTTYKHPYCHLPNRFYLFVAECCTSHTQQDSYMNLCTQIEKDLFESVDPHSMHSLYQANTFPQPKKDSVSICQHKQRRLTIKLLYYQYNIINTCIFKCKTSPTRDSIIGIFPNLSILVN